MNSIFLCFVSGWRRPARGVGRRPAAGAGRIKQTGFQDVAGEYIYIYNFSDRIFFITFRKAVAAPTIILYVVGKEHIYFLNNILCTNGRPVDTNVTSQPPGR